MSIRQGSNIIAGANSGLNVGDIFFTMRPDNELNGAVECDGATYQTTDFTGAQSIGALLEAGKIPYVSLADYEFLLQNDGSVGQFGWDGTGTTAFRVPKLNTKIFVQSRTNAGDFCGIYQPGVPNIKSNVTTNAIFNNVRNQGGTNGAVTMTQTGTINLASGGGQQGLYSMYIDASQSSSIYKNNVHTVQPYAVRYRLMVQLATATTDEALETCTGVLADVANLKDHRVIAFQAPTAQNNYTWYRKYKDGWVEQGGIQSGSVTIAPGAENNLGLINLPVTMQDTSYTALASGNGYTTLMNLNLTTTSCVFIFGAYGSSSRTLTHVRWYVCGMAA
jgi:hypothetical protein